MTANPLSLVAEPSDTRNYRAYRDHDAATETLTQALTSPRLVEDAEADTRPPAALLPGPTLRQTPPGGARKATPRSPMSAAGPSARLMALPQPEVDQLKTPEAVDDYLTQLQAARQRQLDALPPVPRDVVAAAHRDTVTRILEQVRVARQRLSDGLYGICTRCESGIHHERLERQPWSTTCTWCHPPSHR